MIVVSVTAFGHGRRVKGTVRLLLCVPLKAAGAQKLLMDVEIPRSVSLRVVSSRHFILCELRSRGRLWPGRGASLAGDEHRNLRHSGVCLFSVTSGKVRWRVLSRRRQSIDGQRKKFCSCFMGSRKGITSLYGVSGAEGYEDKARRRVKAHRSESVNRREIS